MTKLSSERLSKGDLRFLLNLLDKAEEDCDPSQVQQTNHCTSHSRRGEGALDNEATSEAAYSY